MMPAAPIAAPVPGAAEPALDGAAATQGFSSADIDAYVAAVLDYYRRTARDFPWRRTHDPWRILVSEYMLQQTQTQRVEPKYLAWFELFPDIASLADAPLAEVYTAWQGLGYNSRALRLRQAARLILEEHGGVVPDNEAGLLSLPGVGQYTARAVLAFAFNQPSVFLETNIRSSLIFHFFPEAEAITDRQLQGIAGLCLEQALKAGARPRDWYYALMDHGAYLKKLEVNPSRRSKAYTRQSAFAGSLRQVRGAVLAGLRSAGAQAPAALASQTGYELERIELAAAALVAEGLLRYRDDRLDFAD